MNMRIMTRIGEKVLDILGDGDFTICLHSVGYPLTDGKERCCMALQLYKVIVHFPKKEVSGLTEAGYGGKMHYWKNVLHFV